MQVGFHHGGRGIAEIAGNVTEGRAAGDEGRSHGVPKLVDVPLGQGEPFESELEGSPNQ